MWTQMARMRDAHNYAAAAGEYYGEDTKRNKVYGGAHKTT